MTGGKYLKRKIIIRTILAITLILIGIFLYVIGQEHKLLIDNKDIIINENTYTANTDYIIWLDNREIGVIEKDERIVAKVTGVSHKIVIEAINDKVASGKKFEKVFKFKNNEVAVINIPAIINDLNEWINKSIRS